ncbi:cobalt-zinc-cadmium efflux system protein [Paenibacillus algorifonticola]|uniref:Cobalt-zinc-cadmium efflux system protein n=1 Tax=Paenibacillus algorifonticola TaxID=684063 RepID=A0A1I2D9B7_9BACL|nr:cation diffusion facilitator family transporter [Paenibacillus algorifonticola]SFE77125.1 cobalt-zinc-cadmium efflux system protein [Paenibacillus algorifonticola]
MDTKKEHQQTAGRQDSQKYDHGHSHKHSHDQDDHHDHNDHQDHQDHHGHSHSEGDQHDHTHGPGHAHGHGHDHSHGPGGHHHFDINGNKVGLIIALSITVGIMFLEFFGGLLTGSLALLADSGHMLSDVSALILSLVAVWFASKPASKTKTYGFYRFEILAALFNGIALFVIAGFIVWEAYHRLFDPPAVASGSMMLIALVGLLANLASAWALMRKGDVHNNLNVRSAYLHVLSDALGSVGAVLAGLLIYLFDWNIADPIISVLVSVLILRSAWSIIKQTLHILMEGTPPSIDQVKVKRVLAGIEGVIDVHDLHIWTITSGLDSLSCHLLVEDGRDSQQILQQALARIEQQFGISHTTIQVETSRIQHSEMKV